MRSKTAPDSTMAEVVLDANVLVGLLYDADAQHARALRVLADLEEGQHDIVLLDFLVQEAVSVLCRRVTERKSTPPDLLAVLQTVRGWYDAGEIRFAAREAERLATSVIDVIRDTSGALNFNDALVVMLAREGAIDALATFDSAFESIAGMQRLP